MSLWLRVFDWTAIGTQRRVHVVIVAEAWAAPATIVALVVAVSIYVGIVVAPDAYTPPIARRFQEQRAQLWVLPAGWGPWPNGPRDAWEQRSYETSLRLFVCNRTESDQTLDFTPAENVVVEDGVLLLAYHSPHSALMSRTAGCILNPTSSKQGNG
jgi:hypothetical protein